MNITISTKTIRSLERLLEDFEGVPCISDSLGRTFCSGPGCLRSMMTCRKCWAVHGLRAVIRSMKRRMQ